MQGLSGALLLTALLNAPRARRALSWRPLARAGECSFYFYLWHSPVLSVCYALFWGPLYAFAREPGRWWATLVAFAGALAITLGLSLLQWRAHRRLMARVFPRLSAEPGANA